MRRILPLLVSCAVVAPACSDRPTNPSATTAAITVRAPAQAAVRLCVPCGNGDLEVVADLTVEETAGVAGAITTITVLLRTGTVVLAGPGQYDAAVVTTLAGTNRIGARGSLVIRNVAMHFPNAVRAQLPAVYSFNVVFRDDNGNTVTADATTQAAE